MFLRRVASGTLLCLLLTAGSASASTKLAAPSLTGSHLSGLRAGWDAYYYVTAHNIDRLPADFFQFTGTGGWRIPAVTDPHHPDLSCGGDAPTMITPARPGVTFQLGDFCRVAKIWLLPTRPGWHTFTVRLFTRTKHGNEIDPKSLVKTAVLTWHGNVR